jgi:hypothetical protein
LALARGGKQWTLAGVAQLREHARPIDQCVDALGPVAWRLQVELDLIAATDAQLKLLDDKLDELAGADPRTRLLRSFKASVRDCPKRSCSISTTRDGSRPPPRSRATRGSCPSSWRAGR